MDKYKSWSELKKYLHSCLCDDLKSRITYFLTRYHRVHNSYGRASISLDKKEIVLFSWVEMYQQEYDLNEQYQETHMPYDEEKLKDKWDNNCTYCEMDFLNAILEFRNLSIQDALNSENYIIKILAIMDKRVGKRTLEKINYISFPDWVKQFYELRISLLDKTAI